MRGLNLASFKKIKTDQKSSTFKNEQGHEIKIAHKGLRPEQLKSMSMLPMHMESGGYAMSEGADPNMDNPAPVESQNDQSSFQPQAEISTQETQPVEGQGQPVQDPNAMPIGDMKTPVDVNAAYQQGQQGIKENQQYESDLSKARQGVEENDIQDRQDLIDGTKRNFQEFKDQQQKFIADYANNHIDPNHYVESMGSAQKAKTAIGLFLGGWGSAYTHQGNPALDFLNKQIDRDIEAQKATLGQKKTLLEANQGLYHDSVLADNATRIQMNDIYAHQIQNEADKLGTQKAKAAADLASSQFALSNSALLQQNAIRATALHSLQTTGGKGMDALSLSQAGLIPQQEAEKEQKSIEAQKTAIEATKSLFAQLNKEQTGSNILNPQSYARVRALKAELVNAVMNASASKRLTRESVHEEIEPLLSKTFNTDETRQTQLDGLLNIVGRHADPTPYMQKIAPNSLPKYPFNSSASDKYTVGQTGYVNGQKVQIINAKGDYRPVK